MLLLLIITLTFFSGASLVAGWSSCRSETNSKLRIAFIALLIAGCGAAVWCTLKIEYQLSPTLRATGFPVPCDVQQLENGEWVDFPGPIGLIVNPILVSSVIALPMSLTLIVRARRRRVEEQLRGFPVVPKDSSE